MSLDTWLLGWGAALLAVGGITWVVLSRRIERWLRSRDELAESLGALWTPPEPEIRFDPYGRRLFRMLFRHGLKFWRLIGRYHAVRHGGRWAADVSLARIAVVMTLGSPVLLFSGLVVMATDRDRPAPGPPATMDAAEFIPDDTGQSSAAGSSGP